jgi:kynurenine 3-monooxygenase
MANASVNIVGAGPTGVLAAIFLRRRGLHVTVYERRQDPRGQASAAGRSINLALAARGIHALKIAGVFDSVLPLLVPMRGRMVHDGGATLQRYGQNPHEIIYSISRHRLTQVLLDVADRRHGVHFHFQHQLARANFAKAEAEIHDLAQGRTVKIEMRPLIAADGAGSGLRDQMLSDGLTEAREEPLAHSYKEFSIPPAANGGYAMQREALHIWPRGNFMLIALPNTDGSFTATLFLPNIGEPSFAALQERAAAAAFMQRYFADVVALMPHFRDEFFANPTGALGTVYTRQWHYEGTALLLGDAAHAIVPFHGQGMNCCFEDCVELDARFARHPSWTDLFQSLERARKPNTDAIAAMALENYIEMRDRVVHPKYLLQRELELALERRAPTRFIPRYSMVMFHAQIPYAVARERGTTQATILDKLTENADAIEQIDFAQADREIVQRLPPLRAPALQWPADGLIGLAPHQNGPPQR